MEIRMSADGRSRTLLLAVALTVGVTAPAVAKVSSVKPMQTWTGQMPASVQPPLQSSLATQADLIRVWALCQVKDTPPTVDFDKRLVLLAVRRGSVVRFTDLKLDDGNLKTSVIVTPDMPAHQTCAIVLIDRAGVTRVNGAPVGK